jgi:type VI secretion system secreted protein VgrG
MTLPPVQAGGYAMSTYTQLQRPLSVHTPLGPDVLLLVGLRGTEAISRLFRFELDLLAEARRPVRFEQLLGQPVKIRMALPDGKARHLHGICSRFSQGQRDATFTTYRMEVVPTFWFLTRVSQSRIFQQMRVPEILKQVLQGIDFRLDLKGQYEPRDYCVQYRESDFAFASRLMEEEGIFYFFQHTENGHKLVIADTQAVHRPPLRGPAIYEEVVGGNRPEDRVFSWEKQQELLTGKVTLWDHCFEVPHKHLEADKVLPDSVQAGQVVHKLKIGNNERLEAYDYPGEYAQRFDGIDPGGGERPGDIQKIFEDNKRTANIRIQQEAVRGLTIQGQSVRADFEAGCLLTLQRHFDADGDYILTEVQHNATIGQDYRTSADEMAFQYENRFRCIPAAVPFRPARLTPKPVIHGTQTAVIVGPTGEEIFTDKYSRVKVQFHWDRQGQNDLKSSCWIRVATPWAGKHWGMIHIPRIGQEVVVAFEDGDPDRPIIVGSVYNADMMPPYDLPPGKVVSGVKSNSTPGGGGYNEIALDDTKGEELIRVHAQYDMDSTIENDLREHVGRDRTRSVGRDESITIGRDRTESIGRNETTQIGGKLSVDVQQGSTLSVGMEHKVTALKISENADTEIALSANASITLTCGPSTIRLGPDGITIQGPLVRIN